MDNENLKRIADALEEILRLVKEDQERMKKLNEEDKWEPGLCKWNQTLEESITKF